MVTASFEALSERWRALTAGQAAKDGAFVFKSGFGLLTVASVHRFAAFITAFYAQPADELVELVEVGQIDLLEVDAACPQCGKALDFRDDLFRTAEEHRRALVAVPLPADRGQTSVESGVVAADHGGKCHRELE